MLLTSLNLQPYYSNFVKYISWILTDMLVMWLGLTLCHPWRARLPAGRAAYMRQPVHTPLGPQIFLYICKMIYVCEQAPWKCANWVRSRKGSWSQIGDILGPESLGSTRAPVHRIRSWLRLVRFPDLIHGRRGTWPGSTALETLLRQESWLRVELLQ